MKFATANKQPVMGHLEPLTATEVLNDVSLFNKLDKSAYAFNAEQSIGKSLDSIAFLRQQIGKSATRGLTPELRAELAGAIGVSVESLDSMPDSEFIGKCLDLADEKIEASQESVEIALGIVFFAYVAIIVAALSAPRKLDAYAPSMKDLFRALDGAFGSKINEALDQVVVNSVSKSEFEKQIKACKECFALIKKPVKDIFDPKFKLAQIEQVAGRLWAAPDSWTLEENYSWWNGWRVNMPDLESKSLRDHGFDINSLKKTCEEVSAMCKELITLGGAAKERNQEINEYFEDKRGFFSKIRDWFTDKRTKEQKAEEAQDKLILCAKYEALDNLSRGLATCVNAMSRSIYEACIKCDKLVKKEKKD